MERHTADVVTEYTQVEGDDEPHHGDRETGGDGVDENPLLYFLLVTESRQCLEHEDLPVDGRATRILPAPPNKNSMVLT